MPERVVKVTMTAQVAQYRQGMLEAAKATREVGTASEKLAQQREAFQSLGRIGLATGTLVAAGFALAVKKFADFEQGMSAVQAATHETTANMDLLRQAALDAGASTVFSATEAAGAIEELSKAGVSTADILNGGLNAALDLAAAGGLEVADAAGIAATALKVFNLRGEDMAHVADLLAAGAGKAMGDVSDLSQALAQGGQVAAATGLTIEETTAALSAFASQGLLGSDAGTSFKTMLQRLTPQSAEAQKKMDELGISAYDAAGQFVGLEKFAGNLQTALSDLTPEQRNAALSVMFGSDAVRAANVLYNEGAHGIREWTAAVDDQGYAAETARARLDNLKGDLEALGGAFDTALISSGSAANDVLRDMVQAITVLVDGYNELPDPVKETVLAVGGATAAIALAGGTALLAVPKFIELKATMAGAGISMGRTAIQAGAAGLALGGLFAIVGQLAAEQAEARRRAQEYADTLEQGTNKITDATRRAIRENLAAKREVLWFEQDSALDAAEKLGVNLNLVTKAAEGSGPALKQLNEELTSLRDGSFDTANAIVTVEEAVKGESRTLEDAVKRNELLAAATDENTESTQSAADAYIAASDEVSGLTSKLDELIGRINEANGVGQDAVSANLSYKDALAGVDEVIQKARDGVEGYSATLDTSTQAGRDNLGMLVELASKAQDAAEKQFELDGNTEAYRATLEASRQTLIDRAEQLGMNAEEAGALADQIFRIPSETEWKMIADTAQATWTVQDFMNKYGTLSGNIIYRSVLPDLNGDVSGSGRFGTFASGGAVRGPGTGTSDGEHVWTAAEVAAAGGHKAVENLRGMVRGDQPIYAQSYGSGAGAPVSVSFPDTITLVDANGSILTQARVIAGQEIKRYDTHSALALQAGARMR
ncbi:phage tail tape measure protein [Microbacterium lacus]|uniref:Phage tail tape measure protein n=1 Tax=Microbacterium lacus TaxID=415217 RepID=A0ABN2GWZ0_9MICO